MLRRAIAGAPLLRLALVLTTLALISSACASGRTPAGDAADPGSTVIELRSISALQERFNRDAGAVRLVLLLSPT